MIQGFIFDMDGTMVDNMMTHHRAWQRKLAALGLELSLDEVRQSIHGINEEIIERLFGERFTPEDRRRIAGEKEAEYRQIFLPELKLVDGLAKFLHSAQKLNIPMGIGTAAPPENVQFVLTELRLQPFFHAVIDSKMVQKGKPNPEVFLRVAEKLNLEPKNCLVFEDSPTGVEAAQRGGMSAVVITTTHTPDEFSGFDNVLRVVQDFKSMTPEDWIGER
jgi:beta-phosphoglucomutase family hydrolase